MSEKTGTPAPRYYTLDYVRATAMLMGVVYHAGMFVGRGGGPNSSIEPALMDWSHSFRMSVFFLISGFFGHMMLLEYGLALHPEKTRLVPFERPPHRADREGTQKGTPPGSFDLLGFTHFWGRSRNGFWVVKRQTSKSRFRRSLNAIAPWCRDHRHRALADQHCTLSQKLRGHLAYYGITGNAPALHRFRRGVIDLWRRWLSRRHRGGRVSWERMYRLLEHYPLPPVAVVHSVYRQAAKA